MMRNKTYYNVLRAAKMIRAKGYDEQTSYKIAVQCFDNMEQTKNGMPVEWFIESIVTCEEYNAMIATGR